MKDEELLELKAALEASWKSNEKTYQEKYGWSKEEFCKNALHEIDKLCFINNKSISEVEENLNFISGKYRRSISEKVFKDAYYITNIYEYVRRGEARLLGGSVSPDEKHNRIIEEFKEMEKKTKKRSFSQEANYLDSFLLDVKTKYRVELLNRIMNNDKSFNIHFPSKKFNELYESDLDKLKLLLLDNAYRIYVVTQERSGESVWKMLSDKEGPSVVQEYHTNCDILSSYMSEVHNVADYVSKLNQTDLEMLINIYVLSLNSRVNANFIRYANTINSSHGDRFEVFKQLESLETIDEIKKLNNQGYNY